MVSVAGDLVHCLEVFIADHCASLMCFSYFAHAAPSQDKGKGLCACIVVLEL